jgi:iron-sulfur cluster assembly accessory protein
MSNEYKKEEDLDDVIASLLDDVDEVEGTEGSQGSAGSQGSGVSTLPGFPEVSGEISEQPVILTARAARQVEKIRRDEGLGESLYLRVAVEGGGCAGLSYKLGFDHRNEEDHLFVSTGVEIVIDPKHVIYLDGIQIDYPDGLDARGFTFDNPNASESCGCGTSFAV